MKLIVMDIYTDRNNTLYGIQISFALCHQCFCPILQYNIVVDTISVMIADTVVEKKTNILHGAQGCGRIALSHLHKHAHLLAMVNR